VKAIFSLFTFHSSLFFVSLQSGNYKYTSTMNIIPQRLAALRDVMKQEHLVAVIVPTTDPHQSEYTADHWKCREYITGFTGSAGTAVVTMNGAALWTDSRYFIQAEEQLRDTGILLMREKMPDTPTIAEWLYSVCGGFAAATESYASGNHSAGTEVAIDGSIISTAEARCLRDELRSHGGFTLRTNIDLVGRIWRDRPMLPTAPIVIHPLEYAGEGCASKLTRIRQALARQGADGMLMARLDDIAWTLNLRGSDVHCTPLFISYLLIAPEGYTLYIYKEKLSAEVQDYLHQNNIDVAPYTDVTQDLAQYFGHSILLDPDEVCLALRQAVGKPPRQFFGRTREPARVVEEPSPVPAMKAIKNATEQDGFRHAMICDGVAMVQFLHWLDEQVQTIPTIPTSSPSPLTELSIASRLESLRAAQPLYKGLSFDTISAYGPNAAIVHYEPTPDSDTALRKEGLLLLDSGAQYLDGTTDITRTIALGNLTDEERTAYTLVLKGHLQLQNMLFPDGASGHNSMPLHENPCGGTASHICTARATVWVATFACMKGLIRYVWNGDQHHFMPA
jgi:Xaa-Pro aminopeptidase